ncbi:MAG: EAL domain-containing protein [Sphingomonas sp.]|uniref:EAL domain-containing protein n=1 Tax=Sphingomonas sp. TaxID=28214 RepID=UPI001ACC35BD|nr:EAL domain-containing protein [Sphingomonas sp.]MBN8807566.1 EAL domain-containing protein [Sphingomonas sp.]
MSAATSSQRSVLIRSAMRHAELAGVVRGGGWPLAEDGELGDVLLLDARDDGEAALADAEALRSRSGRVGMVVLVAAGDVALLDRFHAAGATHFLVAPFGDDEVRAALRFAGGAAGAMAQPADDDGARRWLAARLPEGATAAVRVAISRFDLVNSGYGRDVGDALIEAAARRLAGAAWDVLGEHQLVARAKGPEFLVVFDAPDQAEALAERLAAALSRPFAIEGALVTVGARFGVGVAEAGEAPDTLLRRAADALDDARASGGATIRLADQPPIAEALSVDLRRAIDTGEIAVLFQPQVEVATGRIVGVEALARWEHGVFGAVGAEQLFAAADRADLGLALSDHLQQLTLAGAARWPMPLGGLRLSLNLTAADIARAGFVDRFLDRVDASGFARTRLTVEITESGLIEDLSGAGQLLAALRHAGCRVAIDDFGTGYSSLAYLKALPLDYLKLDKKLAQDIGGSHRDRVVVRGVIDMARSLGLAVIAEGVETGEQLDLLAKEGCQYYQGFLCAEPLTSEALAGLVAGGRS